MEITNITSDRSANSQMFLNIERRKGTRKEMIRLAPTARSPRWKNIKGWWLVKPFLLKNRLPNKSKPKKKLNPQAETLWGQLTIINLAVKQRGDKLGFSSTIIHVFWWTLGSMSIICCTTTSRRGSYLSKEIDKYSVLFFLIKMQTLLRLTNFLS